MQLSAAYTGLLSKLESIAGAVPGKPGRWTWYYDNIGVVTLGYGHTLHHPVTGGLITRALYGANCASLANQAMAKYYGAGVTDISMDEVLRLKSNDMQNFSDAVIPHVRADTLPDQFDMMVDFAYNVGEHAEETSTLLRLHNAGKAPMGPLDPKVLASNSRGKVPITTIADAFCAWSNSGKVWTLGVFHRRCCEALIYSGMDYDLAYNTAWAYHL